MLVYCNNNNSVGYRQYTVPVDIEQTTEETIHSQSWLIRLVFNSVYTFTQSHINTHTHPQRIHKTVTCLRWLRRIILLCSVCVCSGREVQNNNDECRKGKLYKKKTDSTVYSYTKTETFLRFYRWLSFVFDFQN